MKHISKHIVTFRPFDVSKWRSEKLWVKIWLETSSGTFEANTKRCACSVVWTRRGVCCEKQHMKFFGGIRSLHWKCSNLRHCRVFYGFWLIEGMNNMNPRRYIAKGDLLTEKTGRSRSGLGLIFQGHGRRRRDWSQGVSWGSCKGLKRKTRELNSCEKKKALNIKNSMWTCFPWSFTGFHGIECFDFDTLLVGEAFQERAAKEKIMLEESFHVKS